MKWIGQHIWDKISRFRNDVYLDSPTAGGSDPDKFLGVDSNNKIIYRTGSQVLSDIGAGTPLTTEQVQDIVGAMFSSNTETNITATYQDADGTIDLEATDTNTQNSHALSWVENSSDVILRNTKSGASSGTQDINILAGSNITIAPDAPNDITISATNTTYSAGNLLDLSTTTFNVDLSELTDGTAAIDGSQDELVYLDNGSQKRKLISEINLGQFNNDQSWTANVGDITAVKFITDTGDANCIGTEGAISFSMLGGTGVDVTNSSTTITVSATTASDSAKGVVELATTGEADTGTDTARAVTPAGLKSHVDSRYTYQYLNFSFKANNIPIDCWVTPSQNGPEYYLWNNTHGSGQTQGSSGAPSAVDTSATISVDYLDQPSAFVVPLNGKLVGFRGNCRTNGNSPNTLRPVMAIFRAAEPSDGNTSDVTATCIAFDKYDTASGNRKNRFLMLTTSVDVDLTAGDLLFPAVGYDATASDGNGDIWGSFTMVLKTQVS